MKKRMIYRLEQGVPKIIGADGYVRIKCGLTWVQEHRLVVENFIGRKLTNEETIHHLDHNRMHNSIENLMLFPNQKEHKAFENKIKQFGITNPIMKQINERWNIK